MTTMADPIALSLLAALCDHPREWDRMLVLADRLEELGDETAAGWRLLAMRERWPDTCGDDWAWLDATPFQHRSMYQLPGDVWAYLAGNATHHGLVIRVYSTLPDALTAAARAYAAAIAAGWQPAGRERTTC